MSGYTRIVLVVALLAGICGFVVFAGAAATIAKLVCVILAIKFVALTA